MNPSTSWFAACPRWVKVTSEKFAHLQFGLTERAVQVELLEKCWTTRNILTIGAQIDHVGQAAPKSGERQQKQNSLNWYESSHTRKVSMLLAD